MEEWLIVDGYNVLGASSEAAQSGSLEEARDRLIRRLSEYQAISGRKVILVFDAHRMPGAGTKQELERIEVHYTRHRETADERIEKLVRQLRQPGRQGLPVMHRPLSPARCRRGNMAGSQRRLRQQAGWPARCRQRLPRAQSNRLETELSSAMRRTASPISGAMVR